MLEKERKKPSVGRDGSIQRVASESTDTHLENRMATGTKDHTNIRILHSGSKAHSKGDTRNHGLYDPYVYVVFWAHSGACPNGAGPHPIEQPSSWLFCSKG